MQVGERVDGEDRDEGGKEQHAELQWRQSREEERCRRDVLLNETREEMPRFSVKDGCDDVQSVGRSYTDHDILGACVSRCRRGGGEEDIP